MFTAYVTSLTKWDDLAHFTVIPPWALKPQIEFLAKFFQEQTQNVKLFVDEFWWDKN